jgi:hypothetical protein
MGMNAKLGLLVAAAISLATLPTLADKHEVPKTPDATQEHEYKFEEFKAKHLQRIKENLACVEAAKDFQDLRKCKPERGNRGMRGGHESGSSGKAPADAKGGSQE